METNQTYKIGKLTLTEKQIIDAIGNEKAEFVGYYDVDSNIVATEYIVYSENGRCLLTDKVNGSKDKAVKRVSSGIGGKIEYVKADGDIKTVKDAFDAIEKEQYFAELDKAEKRKLWLAEWKQKKEKE